MVNKRAFVSKGKSSAKGKVLKEPVSVSVYCHLCKIDFSNNEEFKLHIMQRHRPRSKLYEGESDTSSDSELESPKNNEFGSDNVSHDKNNKLESSNVSHDNNNKLGSKNGSLDKNDENFNPGILSSNKNIFSNISETAVSPQSFLSLKSKENIGNGVLTAVNQLEGKKASEDNKPSSPLVNQNAKSVPDFSTQNSIDVNPKIMVPDNQLPLVNPLFMQSLTNSFQTVHQPTSQSQPLFNSCGFFVTPEPAFTLNVKNIIEWYDEWKKLSKPLNTPLPKRYLKKIEDVYKTIFDNLHLMGFMTDLEKLQILKVFEEMKGILDRNLELFGESF